MRLALAMLAAALFGGPAMAAPAGLELAQWVTAHTDLPATQVAIAGPDNVYSIEPLGPPAATGEVIARVRTEAVDADWRAAHKFQSWEAHALFDCDGKRVRIVRSASYSERNLRGEAKADDVGGSWFAPKPSEPAATLLAAACDRDFAWPLRATAAAAQPPAPAAETPALVKAELVVPELAATPKLTSAVEPSPRAVAPARKLKVVMTLASHPPSTGPPEAAASVEKASVPAASQEAAAVEPKPSPERHVAMLVGTPKAAVARVRRLADAGQEFVTRRAASVTRWLAWKSAPPPAVQQAAL
ncbi:hypothetical protein LJR219_001452 [Phenylobacterium sp. LjRoot219]|uniref:surface-adhesin E family protein n=1 Tax=Phenylobacterium sp. LjRoot219 TaxID=3342283 RepID=UPI003ED12001